MLCTNDSMQVRLHQLLDKIDLREVIDGWRFDDVKDGDDLSHVIRPHETYFKRRYLRSR